MGLTLAEQLKVCEELCEAAYDDLVRFVADNKDAIIESTRLGLIAGYDQYRDATWEKTPEELNKERLYEVRDANVYTVIRLHKEASHAGESV